MNMGWMLYMGKSENRNWAFPTLSPFVIPIRSNVARREPGSING